MKYRTIPFECFFSIALNLTTGSSEHRLPQAESILGDPVCFLRGKRMNRHHRSGKALKSVRFVVLNLSVC